MRGGRRPRGQCARRALAEAKRFSQRSVIGWVTKILLFRASEGSLSRWSWLHLQLLAPTPSAPTRKNNCRIFNTSSSLSSPY
jgi:hypothetical protein